MKKVTEQELLCTEVGAVLYLSLKQPILINPEHSCDFSLDNNSTVFHQLQTLAKEELRDEWCLLVYGAEQLKIKLCLFGKGAKVKAGVSGSSLWAEQCQRGVQQL